MSQRDAVAEAIGLFPITSTYKGDKVRGSDCEIENFFI